jgi:hypothetical protein
MGGGGGSDCKEGIVDASPSDIGGLRRRNSGADFSECTNLPVGASRCLVFDLETGFERAAIFGTGFDTETDLSAGVGLDTESGFELDACIFGAGCSVAASGRLYRGRDITLDTDFEFVETDLCTACSCPSKAETNGGTTTLDFGVPTALRLVKPSGPSMIRRRF